MWQYIRVFVCLIGVYSISTHAINWDPIPNSFLRRVVIIPSISAGHYPDMSFSSENGSADFILMSRGLGIGLNEPYEGFVLWYDYTNGQFLAEKSDEFSETTVAWDVYGIRYYVPIVTDDFSRLSLFVSGGYLRGYYTIQMLSESKGVTAYRKRYLKAPVAMVGAVFSYHLNPEWSLNLDVAYRFVGDVSVTTPFNKVVATDLTLSGMTMSLSMAIGL
jgi:hypothetical protein